MLAAGVILAGLAPWAAWAGDALLHELDSDRAPDASVFPRVTRHRLPPALSKVQGPKATNKFWANWVVSRGEHGPIFPMPYALKWRAKGACAAAEMTISHGTPQYEYGGVAGPGRITKISTPFVSELSLGAVEELAPGHHTIVREGLFGVHVQVRGLPANSNRKVTYPVFSGMAYVSGRYENLRPRISAQPRAMLALDKVRPGVWAYRHNGGREFRVYVLTENGAFADDSFNFDQEGRLNKPLDGWVRAAAVNGPSDAAALDEHAGSVLVNMELDVESSGVVRYRFQAHPAGAPILHFAFAHHMKMLSNGSQLSAAVAPSQTPTKGNMRAVVGSTWTLKVDTDEASQLDFLPPGEPRADRKRFLRDEALGTLDWFLKGVNWRTTMFKGSYYFSGKGFQKVAMVCLLVEKFFGAQHGKTQRCAGLLAHGFKCLYNRAAAGDCTGAPVGSYYDEDWGGVPSRQGFHDVGCEGGADFGNACYNDHHYHFGYFVVSAAILAKLMPAYAQDHAFVAYINDLIRDTANPSSNDPFFPRFRHFDWFALHSWSRGVVPSGDGKDQESTSEEVNLLYGLFLWGRARNDAKMQQLGSTMLALCSMTLQEFFLMKNSNPHYPAAFVQNHVTGIFFQNKLDYTTWFGTKKEFIHGIQMLPLTPALFLSRKAEFCQQEWSDIVSKLPLPPWDPWTSVLLTGSLALVSADAAYGRLAVMDPGSVDDGLTRAYALYWAATQDTQEVSTSGTAEAPGARVGRTPAAIAAITSAAVALLGAAALIAAWALRRRRRRASAASAEPGSSPVPLKSAPQAFSPKEVGSP
uniref:glucan endo-1,3-beta-D-glucosidase n=1 Tax=Zooxanthella nutricula TaxID=1333877 RepID=A0A7S2N8J0_9DINO